MFTMNSNKKFQLRHALMLSAAVAGGFSLTAQAQLMLEEVVVTSQKRVESLADVPISVNVVSGEKITQAGITNLNDLADFVPNLSMNQTGISTTITIRGISSGVNPAFEQSVGMYVDDIHYGRMQMARIPYLDVDRVEVLRGPQPILFGKNAIGGAISLVTKKASTEQMEGFVAADYNFDQGQQEFSGAINVPLSDEFAVRISALARDTDGYYENTALGRDESQLEHRMGRANFQWDATDNLSMNFKYEYASFDTDGRFLELINPVEVDGSPSFSTAVAGLTGGAVVLDTDQDFKRQANGDIEETNFDNATFSLEYALGEHTLTATSGWLEYDYYQQCDCDFSSAILIDTAGAEEYSQFSQELRITSPGGQTVDYIAGVFYQDYDLQLNDMTIVPVGSLLGALSATLPGTAARRAYFTDSEMLSAFAQFTWNIGDAWRLTVGGRYTSEDKTGRRSIEIVDVVGDSPVRDINGQQLTTNPIVPFVYQGGFGIISEQTAGHNLAGERSEDKFTPAINLQWDASDSTMVYVSITEGFKGGGFDARANTFDLAAAAIGTGAGAFEFEEEEVLSFEVGAKMSLAGGAAELNIAAYRMEYDNLQTSQFDGTLGFNVTNAGEATSQGIELDGRWQAGENLLLTGAVGWLDFEFDRFPNSQCFFGETPDSTENGIALCDRKGQPKEFTPEITANIGATYIVAIGDTMELSFGVDLAYSDEYFVSPTLDPNLVQESYTKVNARIGLDAMDGSWSVAVMGENLSDESILTFGNQAPVSTTLSGAFNNAIGATGVATAYYGFYEAPMNVSLQARYNF
ncbi:MAG: TonB-dependent receptor [Pseudomonadales bacterium]